MNDKMDENYNYPKTPEEFKRKSIKLNYFSEAADYLMAKGCFSGAAILADYVIKQRSS